MMRLISGLGLAVVLTACSTVSTPSAGSAGSGEDSLVIASLRTAAPRTWHYLVQLPAGYEKDESEWPLVVFLHGAGGCGSDLNEVKKHGPPMLVARGKAFPFVLVSPQCPEGLSWYAPEVDMFVEKLMQRYRINPKRVYLTGFSLGGFGTWNAATFNPTRYAAIIPICGGGAFRPEVVGQRLKNMPVWAFHGAKDDAVPPERSEERVNAINAAGGRAKLTVYRDCRHDCWTVTYNDPAVWEWLLAQRRP
jgi:predicted peptidase